MKNLTTQQALNELVTWAVDNSYCSTATTIRALLLSLYNSQYPCDLSAVQGFDKVRRRALCAVIMGIGCDVYDHEIREAFAITRGEVGLRWFLEPTGQCEESLIQHFMSAVSRRQPA